MYPPAPQTFTVTLKVKSRSSKHNQLFAMAQWYNCVNLVKSQTIEQKILRRQESVTEFSSFLLLWPWKLDQGYKNLISSLLCHISMKICVWIQPPIHKILCRHESITEFSVFRLWPWKLGQGQQNVISSLLCPNYIPTTGSQDIV